MVNTLLRLEGTALLFASLFAYWSISENWILFLVLFFTPDVSMIGYMKDKKLGAAIYNIGHSYVFALALIGLGLFFSIHFVTMYGIICFAHTSLDRMLGYGLKYQTAFKHTHMQKV